MTPDERQLLSGLFDRINTASNQPRDREAESFINDRIRSQPYAPYLLSQTVIVQEQALRAAADRIKELEAAAQHGSAQPQEETSFLGSIGKSLFGGGSSQNQNQGQGGYAPQGGGQAGAWGRGPAPQQPAPNYPPQQGGPWGQQGGGGWGQQGGGFAQQAPQGGGFLRGALGAAAGVAGGVLAADALRGLFGGHNNPFGIASGTGAGGGETVVNNYYDSDNGGNTDMAAADAQQDFLQDQADDFASNDDYSGDDSYNA